MKDCSYIIEQRPLTKLLDFSIGPVGSTEGCLQFRSLVDIKPEIAHGFSPLFRDSVPLERGRGLWKELQEQGAHNIDRSYYFCQSYVDLSPTYVNIST